MSSTASKTPVAATTTPTSTSRPQSPNTSQGTGGPTSAAAPKKTTPTAAKPPKTDDDPNSTTQRCKHCKQQVPKEGFSTHSKQCLRKKKEEKKKREEALAKANSTVGTNGRATEKDAANAADEGQQGSRAGTVGPDGVPLSATSTKETKAPGKKEGAANNKKSGAAASANSKKRKADALLDDAASVASSNAGSKPPTKKMKKKEPNSAGGAGATEKKTGGKPKGPVDVERQCGVLLPNGSMCARSLTCKSHSMGAKRGVPGRSLPYDVLLANYQKKNQARQQKERMAAHGAAMEELMGETGEQGPVDSDEERERVMSAIARSRPRPLTADVDMGNTGPMGGTGAFGGSLTGVGSAQYVGGSVAKRYMHVRLKEMLGNALGGSRGGGLFSTGPAARERSYGSVDEAQPLSAGMGPQSAGLAGTGSMLGQQRRRQSSVGGAESVRRESGTGLETAMAA